MVINERMHEALQHDPDVRDLYNTVYDRALALVRQGSDPALVAMALASVCSGVLAVANDRRP